MKAGLPNVLTILPNEYRGYDFNSVTPTSAEFKAAQLPFGGILYTNDNNQYSYNIQNKLQFSKAFNPDNRLNALLGMELRSSTAKGTANKVGDMCRTEVNVLLLLPYQVK